jgi:hypothetical protein
MNVGEQMRTARWRREWYCKTTLSSAVQSQFLFYRLELQSNSCRKPTLPFLRNATGSNSTMSAFGGKADVVPMCHDVR